MDALTPQSETDDLRISTKDIADDVKKEHFHVSRDFENLCKDIGIEDPSKFGGIYFDVRNRKQNCYLLPKDLAMTLITGYRADLRFKVIKRIEKLEAEREFKVPATYAEALQLAVEQARHNEKIRAIQQRRLTDDFVSRKASKFCLTSLNGATGSELELAR